MNTILYAHTGSGNHGCEALVRSTAKMLGGMVPLAAEKVGLDPALMANPIIASLVDLASMLVYLCIAMVILGI